MSKVQGLRNLAGWLFLAMIGGIFFSVGALAAGVNHAKFGVLKQDFKSGPEVTRACLTCHDEAAGEVMKTPHWTLSQLNPSTGQMVGKKTLVNNFCIGIASNYPDCTSCHVGYGFKDKTFDFTKEENVDCLACHDTTGTYRKPSGLAGHPVYQEMEFPPGSGEILRPVDLRKVAQNVGKTSRYTCGACHYYGGHGNGVKHGDLDASLEAPDRELDVHMDALGLDFSCATCHKAAGHKIAGSRYQMNVKRPGPPVRGMPEDSNTASCESCHGAAPHSVDTMAKIKPIPGFTTAGMAAIVNQHNNKLACQTCHIPAMARGGVPTKMLWDWSAAGKMGPDGKPTVEKDAKGHTVYDSKRGTFVLAENVVPEYVWFNGEVKYTLLGDKVKKGEGHFPINRFGGSPNDGKSRIWPVKFYRGVQPYDPVNQTLVIPNTYDDGSSGSSYFASFNWEKAVAAGMADAGAPFSGKVDFIKTEMLWPITHMVAPKEKALACNECHSRNGSLAEGRMKKVPGLKKGPLFKLNP